MKIVIIAFSWAILVVGVGSNGLAQETLSLNNVQADQPSDSQLSDLLPAPIVTPVNYLEPITESMFGSCGNDCCSCDAGCCGGNCCEIIPGWKTKFAPYLWLSEIHGNATVQGVTQDIHVSTRDLLNLIEHDTHFFFAGKLELEQEQGPLGIITNGYYLNAGLGTDLENFNFTKKLEQAILDVAFTYELEGMSEALCLPPCSQVEFLTGIRYWMFDTAVTVTGPLNNTGSFDGKSDWVDPIVGTRVVVPLNCYSNLQIRGDVGGFDWGTASDFTWNFEALVEIYWSDCCDIRLGYRVLDIDHSKNIAGNQLGFDMQYRGPVAELAFTF